MTEIIIMLTITGTIAAGYRKAINTYREILAKND